MYSKLSNILNDINSVLLPRACFGCNARLNRGENQLCTVCRNQLPLTEYTFNVENAVDRIFFGRTTIKKANSFLFFVENGIVKNLLHHLKYRNQEQIGTFLGDWHGQIIAKNNFIDKIDYVIPVPLHHKKLKRRGYNQVSLFGKQLALHLKAEFLENGLIKTSNTKTQTKKTRIGRWQNNKALYMLNKPELITNKNILLVDDVITTGATMEICAQTLGEAKGVTIFITSMAVVPLT
ncbi:ComF family protein [Maribacter sp. HTCC2170]|uniref:ComF family protein n=1 Tax=Maribacter sp. (strain HTCC2170 / KCCM 42371) TaxID=313603 RepID=UPI00032536F8|nr:ComF family protein [Maribacter sp. HTCC2170]